MIPTMFQYSSLSMGAVALSFPRPKSAAESRALVRQLNAAEAKKRIIAEEKARLARIELQRQSEEATRAAPTARFAPARPKPPRSGRFITIDHESPEQKLDVEAIYAARRAKVDAGARPTGPAATTPEPARRPAPRRPRTLSQIAHDLYDRDGGTTNTGRLIPAGQRGGAQ